MGIDQLIYTDCETGIDNRGTGFQVYSRTENMEDIYLRNIQKMCMYNRPMSLSAMPSEDEIQRICPVLFAYDCLDNTHAYLSRNCYLGMCRLNSRPGNIFSHSICFGLDELNVYPIELYGSELFLSDISKEEKLRTDVPDYLPVIDDMELIAGASFSLEEVIDFFQENNDRFHYLKMMINAAYECVLARNNVTNSMRRAILINDDKENIPFWIAGITHAFPLYIAKQLSFNTYSYDPAMDGYIILGVENDTAYNSSDGNNSAKYYMFDFKNNIFSNITDGGSYSSKIETSYLFDADSLNEFFDFLVESRYDILKGSIDLAHEAYQLYVGQTYDFDVEKLSDTLDFVNTALDSNFLEKFYYNVINNLLDDNIKDTHIILLYMRYAINIGNNYSSTRLLNVVYKLYWNTIKCLVGQYNQIGEKTLDRFVTSALSINQDNNADLLEFILDKSTINSVVSDLRNDTSEFKNKFWAIQILRFIDAKNITIENFARKYDSSILAELIQNLQLMNNPMNCISYYLTCGIEMDLAYDLFESTLTPVFASKRNLYVGIIECVYNLLIEKDARAHLVKLFSLLRKSDEYNIKQKIVAYFINTSSDAQNELIGIYNAIMRDNRDFWTSKSDEILADYYNMVKDDVVSRREFCCLYLEIGELNAKKIDKIIKLYDSTIDFTTVQDNDGKSFKKFLNILKEKNIQAYVSSKFFTVGKFLGYMKSGVSSNIDTLQNCQFTLFSIKELEVAVEMAFEKYMPNLCKEDNHLIFYEAFGADQLGADFYSIYTKLMCENIKSHPKVFCAGLYCIKSNNLELVKECLIDSMIETKVSGREKEIVERNLHVQDVIYWNKFCDVVDERKKGKKSAFANKLNGTLNNLKGLWNNK